MLTLEEFPVASACLCFWVFLSIMHSTGQQCFLNYPSQSRIQVNTWLLWEWKETGFSEILTKSVSVSSRGKWSLCLENFEIQGNYIRIVDNWFKLNWEVICNHLNMCNVRANETADYYAISLKKLLESLICQTVLCCA